MEVGETWILAHAVIPLAGTEDGSGTPCFSGHTEGLRPKGCSFTSPGRLVRETGRFNYEKLDQSYYFEILLRTWADLSSKLGDDNNCQRPVWYQMRFSSYERAANRVAQAICSRVT